MTDRRKTPARRILALALGAMLTAPALPAAAMERIEIQNLPQHMSLSSFQSLSKSKLHEIATAQKHGERVLIGAYGASASRAAIDEALNRERAARDATGMFMLPGAAPMAR